MDSDTLNSISLKFDTTPGELARLNKRPLAGFSIFSGDVSWEREGGREGGRERGKERGREGEGGREGGRERIKEGQREVGREGERGGREGGRKRREGGRERGGREGGREGENLGRREGGREGENLGRREGGREGGRKEASCVVMILKHFPTLLIPFWVQSSLQSQGTQFITHSAWWTENG